MRWISWGQQYWRIVINARSIGNWWIEAAGIWIDRVQQKNHVWPALHNRNVRIKPIWEEEVQKRLQKIRTTSQYGHERFPFVPHWYFYGMSYLNWYYSWCLIGMRVEHDFRYFAEWFGNRQWINIQRCRRLIKPWTWIIGRHRPELERKYANPLSNLWIFY